MMAFLILLLHILAKLLTFLDCPTASNISAKYVNSTLSIAFAGVRNAENIEVITVYVNHRGPTHQTRSGHPMVCGGFQPSLCGTGQMIHESRTTELKYTGVRLRFAVTPI